MQKFLLQSGEWCGAQALPRPELNADSNGFCIFHLMDLKV